MDIIIMSLFAAYIIQAMTVKVKYVVTVGVVTLYTENATQYVEVVGAAVKMVNNCTIV